MTRRRNFSMYISATPSASIAARSRSSIVLAKPSPSSEFSEGSVR
jgi:hypothetical protein